MKLHIHSQTSKSGWRVVMDKLFHPTCYWVCDNISMLRIHVGKMCSSWLIISLFAPVKREANVHLSINIKENCPQGRPKASGRNDNLSFEILIESSGIIATRVLLLPNLLHYVRGKWPIDIFYIPCSKYPKKIQTDKPYDFILNGGPRNNIEGHLVKCSTYVW